MPLLRPRPAQALVLAFAFAACHSEHQSNPPEAQLGPRAIGLLPVVPWTLDQPALLLFQEAIDPASCTAETVQIVGLDGPGAGKSPAGRLVLTALGDGSFPNAVVRFVPSLRVLATTTAAEPDGLWPDTTYAVRLPAGGLRTASGVALLQPLEFQFRTVPGASHAELYANLRPLGPAVASSDFEPRVDGDRLAIGTVRDTPSVVRVRFDQPIDTDALPVPYDSTETSPGFASLVYDDPVRGFGRVIPTRVDLTANDVDGGELALRPEGILPNAALVRVLLRGTLRDASGEVRSFVDAAAMTVRTEDALRPRGDAVIADWGKASNVDFVEPIARHEDGVLRAADAFPPDEPGAIVGDWSPTQAVTDLDTAEQTLVYENGRARTFAGGVFRVRNLRIPVDHTVRGRGPNPLVFVVEGDAIIDGEITVRGGDAAFPAVLAYRGPGDVGDGGTFVVTRTGGEGRCGGGDGGEGGMRDGQFQLTDGLPGRDAQGNATGGGPGLLATGLGNQWASGGGGGSFSTLGDPGFWFARPAGFGAFVQRDGQGGYGYAGGITRSLRGGDAGAMAFVDARVDNDFCGDLYDPRRRTRIRGELGSLRGGSGGGSGGDSFPTGPGQGGGGGAGGGVLVVQAQGRVTIGASGLLDANGGDGAMPNNAGGGGGGSGGTVVVMAGDRIVLHAHGGTIAERRDTRFCIRADGGFGGVSFTSIGASKYAIASAEVYDDAPRGGFGGLGLIQLMAPMGTTNEDGTNTVLDDAIDVVLGGLALQGTQKMRYLAWRGLGTEAGTFVDDFGNPTGFAWGEGDMRPSPVLLPVPYGPRSRARSEWIALGAADRRPLAQHDGLPRAVVVEDGVATGPDFGHATRSDGWLDYEIVADRAVLRGPAVLGTSARVVDVDATAVWNGAPALLVQLDTAALGTAVGLLSGYEAELSNDRSELLHRLRVLSHDGTSVWLTRPVAVANDIASLQLRHGLSRVASESLPTYRSVDGNLRPVANVRIGAAFHRDPRNARSTGSDPDRLPPMVGEFFHDLGDPVVQQQIRTFAARAVQWDVTFDRRFREVPIDVPPPADLSLDLALDGLWLPFRF